MENGYKVIIADDHPIVRKGLKEIVEEISEVLSVDEAEDGYILIDKAAEHDYDLIILDVSMPGMSGLELLKNIKEDADTEKIPVIVVTADKTMEVVDEAFLNGADDFIVKPFEKAELIESVERFIG